MQIETTRLVQVVYDAIIEAGRVPLLDDVARELGVDSDSVVAAIKGAPLGKTLLLDPRTSELWMAGPFSAVPTDHTVTAGSKTWSANCAWDALGVAALIDAPATIHSVCGDCRAPIQLDVDPTTRSLGDLLVHLLVPARDWYQDVGFT